MCCTGLPANIACDLVFFDKDNIKCVLLENVKLSEAIDVYNKYDGMYCYVDGNSYDLIIEIDQHYKLIEE